MARTVYHTDELAFPVTVTQENRNSFTVTYGKQVKSDLTYTQAAREFGECLFHALACDGKLDNRQSWEK